MIAEYTIGLILLVFVIGYALGNSHGRRIERNAAHLRFRRVTNTFIRNMMDSRVGGMRDW